MSRLSKRITQKPRSASVWQNSSSHNTICADRPITSSNGGEVSAPNVS